jgi:hypothetical protein
MRRLGTGTGFACAKLSEILPSARVARFVRMTQVKSIASPFGIIQGRLGRDAGMRRVRISEFGPSPPPRRRGGGLSLSGRGYLELAGEGCGEEFLDAGGAG